jgi:hypothetical protein
MGRAKKETTTVRVAHRDTREWTNIDSYTTENVWHDGWVGEQGSLTITPPADARWLRLVANKMHYPEHLRVDAIVNGVHVRREILAVGHFVVDLPLAPGANTVRADFTASATFVPSEKDINGEDHRNLSWIVVAVQVAK